MILSFELTMPNRGSWNGRWSGESSKYFIHRTVAPSKAQHIASEPADFYYRWNDGWGANVRVEIVDSATKRKQLKQSRGFCGYDWMADSILEHGVILADHEIAPYYERQKAAQQAAADAALTAQTT